jgi:hypothetical protein
MLRRQRLINPQNGLINPPASVRPIEPPVCGFVRLVTGKSKVHTSWRGFTTIVRLRATSPTKWLVAASALCSRPGAALLKSAAYSLESREIPCARRTY